MVALEIKKETLWGRIRRTASIIGRNAYTEQGAPLYDTIRITDQEMDSVNSLIDDGGSELYSILSIRCKGYSNEKESLTFSLDYSDDTEVSTQALHDACVEYLTDYVIGNWFSVTNPGQVENFTKRLESDRKKVVNQMMYMASMPVLKSLRRIVVESAEKKPGDVEAEISK